MPKKKIEKPQREMTKRQLTHWQKESRVQRITMIGGIILVVVVLILLGTGFYMNKYKPLRQVVIKAGDTEYNMDYLIDMMSYYGRSYNNSGLSNYITYEEYLSYIVDSVAQQIEQNQFLVEAAATLNPPVVVSDEEINQYIKDNSLSSDRTRKDAVRIQLLADKIKDYFDKNALGDDRVPDTEDQRSVLAMFLESQSQADQVIQDLNDLSKNTTFQDEATQLSLESVSKGNGGDFGFVPRNVLNSLINSGNNNTLEDEVWNADITPGTLASVEDKEQTKNIGYWLVEITDAPVASDDETATPEATPEGQVHLMVMLLGSQEEALQVKANLDAGGEGNDFATLAKTHSQYGDAATDGGDMGLVSKDTILQGSAVINAVFPEDATKALTVNKVSDPIADTTQTTKGGFWLVQVSETENKEISDDNRTILINNSITEWENGVWTQHKDEVEDLLNPDLKTYAAQEAAKR